MGHTHTTGLFWAGTDLTNDLWVPIDGRRVPIRWTADTLDYNYVESCEDINEGDATAYAFSDR